MGNRYANSHCRVLLYVICESMYEKNIGKRTKLAWEIFESFVEESEGRAYCGRKAMDFR